MLAIGVVGMGAGKRCDKIDAGGGVRVYEICFTIMVALAVHVEGGKIHKKKARVRRHSALLPRDLGLAWKVNQLLMLLYDETTTVQSLEEFVNQSAS